MVQINKKKVFFFSQSILGGSNVESILGPLDTKTKGTLTTKNSLLKGWDHQLRKISIVAAQN